MARSNKTEETKKVAVTAETEETAVKTKAPKKDTKETVKETVEVTTTVPAQKNARDTSNDVPVITITDDSDNSSVALER